MSFADKRKSRSSRQPKSYVSQSRTVQESAVTVSQIHSDFAEASDEQLSHREELSRTDSVEDVDVDVVMTMANDHAHDRALDSSSSQQATEDEYEAKDYGEVAEHQNLYQTLTPQLEVRKTKRAGRGLWTKKAIKAGSVILSLSTHAHVLSTSNLDSYCSACCAPRPSPSSEGSPTESSGLKRCTKCRVVWYCNSKCQTRDWPAHKSECEALRRWMASAPQASASASGSTSKSSDDEISSLPNDAIRVLGRILRRRRKELEAGDHESIWWNEIAAMQSHRTSTPAKVAESQVHLAHALVRYLSVTGPEELAQFGLQSAGDLVNLISKFATNAFTLSTPSLSPIGTTVSPAAALINHSCSPNAVIVFPRPISSSATKELEEPILQVIAIRDIPAHNEILTSYIDTTLPTKQRQDALQETYNFTCDCSLCVSSKSLTNVAVDWREAVWCPRTCGGICSIPTEGDTKIKCSKCASLTAVSAGEFEALQDVLRLGEEVLEKASSLQNSDPSHALRITSNILPILTMSSKSQAALPTSPNTRLKLTPSTHPLLAINRLHQSLLISSLPSPPTKSLLDATIRASAASVAGLSNILSNKHPVTAVALAELGKLLAVDEPLTDTPAEMQGSSSFPPSGADRLRLAKETLQRAYDASLIGFGKDGEVGRDVRYMLANVEKELSVWVSRLRDVARFG